MTRLLQDRLLSGMIFVDIGANAGYYSLLASGLVGERGRVYAFEPDPTVFEYLKSNVTSNRCQNVIPVPRAVTDTTSSRRFIQFQIERGYLADFSSSEAGVVVEATTLDDYFNQAGWPKIDVIKMDIEGSELPALKGMLELSHRNPQLCVIVEFNTAAIRRAGASPRALTETLRRLGFNNGYVIEQGMRLRSLTRDVPDNHVVFNMLVTK